MGIDNIPLVDLHFDKQNPRLVEYSEDVKGNEEKLVRLLWEAMDAKEIAYSIATSGYFPNDPLIVVEEHGQKIVIEGNRRLAALKALFNPSVLGDKSKDVPEFTESVRQSCMNIPCMVQTRDESWKFLGYKHVNGPAKWSSYAKAKYIVEVHTKYGVPLTEISRQIGDNNRTVNRLYRGLMVVQQAERAGFFNRDDAKKRPFAFSHLYVGLQRQGISEYLGYTDDSSESDSPIPEERLDNLRSLLGWLYGSKRDDIEPLIQSQNPDLKNLDAVLKNPMSVEALRSGQSLQVALELTEPASNILQSNLVMAKVAIQKAFSVVSDGYQGDLPTLKLMGGIANQTDELYSLIERKYNEKNGAPKKERIAD